MKDLEVRDTLLTIDHLNPLKTAKFCLVLTIALAYAACYFTTVSPNLSGISPVLSAGTPDTQKFFAKPNPVVKSAKHLATNQATQGAPPIKFRKVL